MRYPKNKILENQYTSGGQFVEKISSKDYKGYYHIVGGQFFIGKTFKPNSEELIKTTSSKNTLVREVSSQALDYIFLKQNNTQILSKNTPTSSFFDPSEKEIKNGITKRYFIKKMNIFPQEIKEVSKDSFNSSRINPFYQSVEINWNIGLDNTKNIEEGNKKLPGLKEFLSL